jgi:hypothetical protein
MSLCAGSLSDLCASYGVVNSACLSGATAPDAQRQRDLHAENITDIELRSR